MAAQLHILFSTMRQAAAATLFMACCAFAEEPLAVKSVAVDGTTIKVNLETQVGAPFDTRVIERDVRRLWSAGQYNDILVEAHDQAGGTAVTFNVVAATQWPLHEIRIVPSRFSLRMELPEGTPLNRLRAHKIALLAQKQLRAEGYVDARVDYELARFGGNKVDLRLNIQADKRVQVREVEFTGNPGLGSNELRDALHALRSKRLLPGIPGLWRSWRLFPAYNPDAVDSDLARLRWLYLSEGYLDAHVRLDDTAIQGSDARLRILAQSGPRYAVRDWGGSSTPAGFCACLFQQRREAQRQGILDFSVNLDVQRSSNTASLVSTVLRGRPFRVGRIDFIGAAHYKDATIRRNFVLDEGDLLDNHLLAKSLARLNRTMNFQPIDAGNVSVQRTGNAGLADVRIRLTERKRRAWMLSGPIGPVGLAGPLQASITSWLPS